MNDARPPAGHRSVVAAAGSECPAGGERPVDGAEVAVDGGCAPLPRVPAASLAHLAAMYEQAGAGLCETDLQGRFLNANDRYCEIVGRSREELLSLSMQQITHPDDLPANLPLFHRLVTEGTPFSIEKRYLRPDGSEVWIANSVGLLRYPGAAPRAFAVTIDVSEKRRAERAMAELTATLDLANVFVRDPDGTIRYWSKGCERLYGWPAQEAVGRNAHRLLHTVFPVPLAQIEATLEREGEWAGDLRHTTRDGRELTIATRKVLRRDARGRGTAVAEAVTDVTAARQAQAALAHSVGQAQLAAERVQLALAAGAIIGTWLWELTTGTFTVDERFADNFGLSPAPGRAGLSMEQVVAAVHPDDMPGLRAAIAHAIARGGPYSHEYRVRTRDGSYRWIEANGRVDLAADGTPLRFPGVIMDIEGRRTLEAERDQALGLLRAFTDAVPGVVYAKDRAGRMLVANRGVTELLGLPPQHYLGRTDQEFLDDPTQAAAVMANDRRIMDSGVAEQLEETLNRPDGSPSVWLSTKAPFRDAQGRVIGIIGSSLDITARKAAEAALAKLNATLEQQVRQRTAELQRVAEREQAILASAASAIIATDLAGRITAFNPAAEAMLRIPAALALGRLELDFRDHAELLAHLDRYPREVLENATQLPLWLSHAARSTLAGLPAGHDGGQRSEWTYVRADGTRVICLVSISLLRNAQGQPSGFLAVVTDLSERKALEEQLRERTRQAEAANRAKSAFLAHMSHELRTPLNAVIGLSQLLRARALPPDAARFIGHIHDAGEQLLALVSDVLDLSRIEAGEMTLESLSFELRPLLDTALALVRPQADAKGLALVAELAPDLPARAVGDPLRLRQVVLNLLSNAVKFTAGGSVTLRARAHLRPGRRVLLCLEVVDTGIGIAAAEQERIFEPFTQADGSITRRFGGTGLGLSIVRRLVEKMGGTLRLASAPGRGSTFSVELPLGLGMGPS
jgi:PAS domain S-box-containing protein